MIARELAIVFRAKSTWVSASLSALLIGHGFVLAIDLYTAGSRSAETSRLLEERFDPLLGIVRPTLGGLYLSMSLLGPIVAARVLAIEKERRSFKALVLQTGAPIRVLIAKLAAASLGVLLQLIAPVALLLVWRTDGGHLAFLETMVALSAYVLYAILVGAIAMAAAAWTETLAQAVTAAIVLIAASWAIDASEGFAALAWLGRALDWSVTTHLEPLERGTLSLGAVFWMLAASIGATLIAIVGVRFDLPVRRRSALSIAAVFSTIAAALLATHVRAAFDITEDHRISLPQAAESAIRILPGPISLEVNLDRDDARRRQLELDVLAKLRLARPDLEVRFPPDERDSPSESDRDRQYGRTIVRVNGRENATYSSDPREITVMILETAGARAPDWSAPEYPGYPLVLEGGARTVTATFAYVLVPLGVLATGHILTRSRRRRS
jgi:hypothetical protein